VGTENTIRILVLGDARQVHIHRWTEFLCGSGYETLTVSLEPTGGVQGAARFIRVPHALPDFVRYPSALPRIRGIIREFAPHLVNAHFLPNYGMIAALSGFSPWVLSAWGSDVMLLPAKSPFHMWRTRFVIGRADWITSDADAMTRRLIELGARHEKVLTFPYGVDRKTFHPANATAPPPHSAPRIICNRKLESVYNVSAVLEAFASVRKTLPQAALTIAGGGSLRRRLQETASRLGLGGDPVSFTGEVAHQKMPELLRAHDIFVSAAFSDTTSVSLLEAMACGLFPVVSDIAANREWIVHGENGWIVDPRDPGAISRALIAAWEDPALRAAAARKNASLIETRADWYRNMSVVDDLFHRLARS